MYTTPDAVKRFLGLTWEVEIDSIVNEMILASQEYIENYCGDERFGKRRFLLPENEDDAREERHFDGSGNKRLYFGDALRITEVMVDGEVLDSDKYFMYPANASETENHTYLEMSQKGEARIFPVGQQNVRLTGDFYYSALLPKDILVASMKIIGGIIGEHKDIDVKEVTAENLGDYRVTYQTLDKAVNRLGIADILKPYVRTPEEGAEDDTPRATVGLRQI